VHYAAHVALREEALLAVHHDVVKARPHVLHDEAVLPGARVAADGGEVDEGGVAAAGRHEVRLAENTVVELVLFLLEGLEGAGLAVARLDDDAEAFLHRPQLARLHEPRRAGEEAAHPRPRRRRQVAEVVDRRADGRFELVRRRRVCGNLGVDEAVELPEGAVHAPLYCEGVLFTHVQVHVDRLSLIWSGTEGTRSQYSYRSQKKGEGAKM
jgi:hypothetical protein